MDVQVTFRKAGLQAVAHLAAGTFELETATQTVVDQLRSLGVINGIDTAAVRRALGAFAGPEPPSNGVVIAQGEPPRPGIAAQVLRFFPERDTLLSDEIDPFSAYALNVTYPGDAVLQKTPATPGIPGRSLLGTPVPAPEGDDIPVVPREGIVVEEDGKTFRSTRFGIVLFHRGQLRVLDAVNIAEDRMEVRMTVLPDPRRDENAHLVKLLETLEKLGVNTGVDRDALLTALRLARAEGRAVPNVVAARGSLAKEGREPDHRLLIDPDKKIGKILAGDRIDFREAEVVKNVSKGEVLAELIPGVEPVPGFRVDGTVLRPRFVRASGPKPGHNTTPSEDGTKILADGDGMVIIKGGKFHLMDEYVVQGDVDYRTGNIRASGSVLIRGQVKPGFQVHGGKHVEILQDVEEAAIEARGDVTIRGGITAGSRITAGNKVTAKYVQNSQVETDGDLEVKLSLTNSQVYAKGKLTALGAQGAIIGGEINAALGIEARTIGSPSSKTHVAVGVDLRVVREIETIDKERSAVLEDMRIIQSNLGKEFMKDPRAALATIPVPLRKGKLDLLQKMQGLYKRDGELSAQRDELIQLTLEQRGAHISVLGNIHTGTTVTVSHSHFKLTETLGRVRFYYDAEHNRIGWRHI